MKQRIYIFGKIIGIFLLLLWFQPLTLESQSNDSPLSRELIWGKAYNDIGTFGGWSFWIGFDASFSESYTPESESYAWVIHFAPEGIYLSLQKGKALYSGVDVNAGFGFFYGMVKSPYNDRITKDFFSKMSGVTFSVSSFSTNAAGVGPLSNLSAGISSSNTFFRKGKTDTFLRAVQYGAGFSVAYALVSNPFPFSVSLGIESSVEAGFYPIGEWDIFIEEDDPLKAIMGGLQSLGTHKTGSFVDLNLAYMAGQILGFLKQFPMTAKVKEFITSSNENSEIDKLIAEVQQWKQSGDTKNLPEILRPNIPPKEIYMLMKPLQSAANAGFEAGYKRGYDSKQRTDTIYADCLEQVKVKPGSKITIEVTAAEILELVPDANPAQLEGLQVIFDNPPDTYLSSKATETKIAMKGGKAKFEFYTSSTTPILMGIRVYRSAKTKNKSLELCRRLILFEQ
ncbi:MAG: hypothetical protein JW822_14675 [Spirochaetales bacterium]|nr:hypothetical protein [Spirochaetales bacterium]